MANYELYHHGAKGQKWGVRRYQNKDGSLTAAGKKRYARDATEKGYTEYDTNATIKGTNNKDKGSYYKTSKNNGRDDLDIDANRYVKEDLSRAKRLADESVGLTNKVKNTVNNSIRNTPKQKMDLSSMNDKQMRDEINRAILERQYNDMFAPKKSTRGREYALKTLEVAGSVLAIGSSALGIALAIKELKG